jgi:hypothetical protein
LKNSRARSAVVMPRQEVGENLVDTQLGGEGADQSGVALFFNYPFFFD